jgi:hypothetical protein
VRCAATTRVEGWHRPAFNDYIYTYNQAEQDSLKNGGLYMYDGSFYAWNSSTISCAP